MVLVLLLTLMCAIFDLGRAMLVYHAINGATAIAADYGTTADSSSQTGYPTSAQVSSQTKAAFGPAVEPALASVQVDTNAVLDGRAALTVTINYSHPLISPFLAFAFPGNTVGLRSQSVRLYP